MTIIDVIKLNIQAYNKFMTKERLSQMISIELLNNTHPGDRYEFAKKLHKEGLLTDDQLKSKEIENKIWKK